MFFQLIKKDLLVLVRNRNELIILLVMPAVLICILGFALGGMMEGETTTLKAKVYVIEEGSETEELDQFIAEVEQSSDLPDIAKEAIISGAKQTLPISILKNEVLGAEELKEMIDLQERTPAELDEMKSDEEASAIIQVPEQFTYSFLRHQFFGDQDVPILTIAYSEGNTLAANMVESLVTDIQEQFAFGNFLQEENLQVEDMSALSAVKVNRQTVDEVPSVSSAAYYTIGMSTMFVLYVATTIASFARREKELQMYNRILLSDVSPWTYLSSAFISGMLIAYVQTCILFGVSTLLYDVSIPSVSSFLFITLMLCFGVGGFTTLLTAISFRIPTEKILDAISSVVITFIAFLGGSFIPISIFPDWFQTIGSYTLNGAGLKAYMNLLQQYDIAVSSPQLIALLVYGCSLFIIAVFIFPRKGEV